MQQDKKVLLRISNLKQYFPLKKKGLFVKANDGISIDIYAGETFGLVGESGCGKSTLGRTLLQLYHQTDGRTMYYGRTLDEIAPLYVRDTIRSLGKRRSRLHELQRHRDHIKAEFEAIKEDGKEKYAKQNELAKAEKEANDAFLDITNLIGGFLMVEDLRPVVSIYMERYQLSKKRRDAEYKLRMAKLKRDDLAFDIKRAQQDKGAGPDYKKAQMQTTEAKIAADEAAIEAIKKELAGIMRRIEEMRKPYADDPEFNRLEAYQDDGVDLARLVYKEMRLLRSDLQLIFQDPYSSLNPRMTVGQIIGEGLLSHNFFNRNDDRMKEYILKTMDQCGLAAYFLHRFPHQFSGGQRQRIGIARALAVKPKFVVCDEAVSALDVSIQSQIINLLQDLREQEDLTYLFITHDLSVVKYISDRIGVMYLGSMVELADSAEIFRNPVHPYTEALLRAIPTTDVNASKDLSILEGDIPSPVNPPKGCKFHTRCQYCTEICTQVVPEWSEVAPNHFVACHHKLHQAQE